MSLDVARTHNQRMEQHYGKKPLMTNHQLAKFVCHRHYCKGDIIILGCHVISQDQVNKGSCKIMGRKGKVSYHPTKFRDHRHSGSRDIMILVCHVITHDHMIKGHLTLWAGAH